MDFLDELSMYSSDPEMEQTNIPPLVQQPPKNAFEQLLEDQRKQVEAARLNQERIAKLLNEDPRIKARERAFAPYKGMKSKNPLNWLKGLGWGLADVLNSGAGGNYGILLRDEKLGKRERTKSLPSELIRSQQDEIQGSANQQKLINAQDANISRESIAKSKTAAQQAIAEIKDTTAQQGLGIKLMLAQDKNEIDKIVAEARAANLIAGGKLKDAQATVAGDPKNPTGYFSKFGDKPEKLAPYVEFMNKIKPPSSLSEPNLQLQQGTAAPHMSFDANESPIIRVEQEKQVFNPRTGNLEEIPSSAQGARMTALQHKQYETLHLANNQLATAVRSVYNLAKTGNLKEISGINGSTLGKIFQGYFREDPIMAAQINAAMQSGELATLKHLQAVYGSRVPVAIANQIDVVLNQPTAAPAQKISAFATQYLLNQFGEAHYVKNITGRYPGKHLNNIIKADTDVDKFFEFVMRKETEKANYVLQMKQAADPNIARPYSLDEYAKIYEFDKTKAKADKGRSNLDAAINTNGISPQANKKIQEMFKTKK